MPKSPEMPSGPEQGEEESVETDLGARFAAIEERMNESEPLDRYDIIFLYDSDDPKAKEIRSRRNPLEDAPVVLECEPDEIAWSKDAITDSTKAYIGPLFPPEAGRPGVFGHDNLEHIYTSFPEGRVERIKLELGGKTPEDYKTELQKEGHRISDYAKDLLDKMPTSKEKSETELVRFKVHDLFGDEKMHAYEDIQARAKEFGLDLAPAEAGPALRLSMKDRPMFDWAVIGMEAMADRDGSPCVFYLCRDGDGSWLARGYGYPAYPWNPVDRFVFVPRKPAKVSRSESSAGKH